MDNQHLNHSNRSGLAAFKASLFFKIIDWCLINTMVFLCITVDTLAYSHSVRAAELPPTIELTQLIQIGNSTQTGVKRITRSDFDFTYTLNISYIGATPIHQVKGHLISLSPSTQIIDADIDFGNLTPGQTLTVKDTYTIRQDRSKPFDPSALKWSFTHNRPPVASAGADQSVPVGAEVLLDGTGSTDADGDSLTYRWTFTARPNGSVATLDNIAAPKPHFIVDRAGRYVLGLIVNDGYQNSIADTVVIDTENSMPVADAGPDQTVATGDTVYLNGSASRDPDGDALQYTWTLQESPDSHIELNFADSANPHFTATKAGRYVVHLVVSDGKLNSEADLVIVSTRNSAPVADAGPDQTIKLGDPALTLHGGNSHDVDGQTLTYRWAILHAPDGSSAGVDPFNVAEPSFKPDLAGLYVVQLIVNDGELDSVPDTAQINVASPPPPPNQAPKITTSPRTTGTVGQLYTYDVDATDPDIGDILGYSLQVAGPGMIIDALSGLISWTPTEAGDFAVTAKVQDQGGLSGTQNYTLKISAAPPVNRAPQITSTPVTTATVGQLYNYDVDANDPDGDALTYALTQSPEGMTIDNNSGLIQWTPPGINVQPPAVTVRVTDTGGLPAEQNFTISVVPANRAPIAVDDAYTVDQDNNLVIANNSDASPINSKAVALADTEQPAQAAKVAKAYGNLPLQFEANQGQTDPQVEFLARGPGYGLFLTPTEAVMTLEQNANDTLPAARMERRVRTAHQSTVYHPSSIDTNAEKVRDAHPTVTAMADQSPVTTSTLRLKLRNANPNAQIAGLDEQPGKSHYLIGNDPGQWRKNVANYAKVAYDEVYPGIDLVYYGNQRQLEYDFIVAPNADPKTIQMAIEGAENVSIDPDGNLILTTPNGEIRQHKPIVYQETNGQRRPIEGRYVLLANADSDIDRRVRTAHQSPAFAPDGIFTPSATFAVSGNDSAQETKGTGYKSRPAQGQPNLGDLDRRVRTAHQPASEVAVRTELGRARTVHQSAEEVRNAHPTVNASGQGKTETQIASIGFEVAEYNHSRPLVIDPVLVYSSYLGGNAMEFGTSIAADTDGNAYIVGWTSSNNFPVTPGSLHPAPPGGNGDSFITKLSADGSTLLYSTYLGGTTNFDHAEDVVVDSQGNAYVVGATGSIDFPVTPGAINAGGQAFVVKVDPSGANLIYSAKLGAAGCAGLAIAADPAGNVYAAGCTYGSIPATADAAQPSSGGGREAFVVKLNPTGTAVIYGTYIGGSGDENGWSMEIDKEGNAYVTGGTTSSNFPLVNPLQSVYKGGSLEGDAFVTVLNPEGTRFVFSSYLGGSGNDSGYGITVDKDGHVLVSGYTASTDFPLQAAFQPTFGGAVSASYGGDAFLAKIDITQPELIFSTYLGGSADDAGYGVAVVAPNNIVLTGATNSTNFPLKDPIQANYAGGPSWVGTAGDIFLAKFDSTGSQLRFSTYLGGSGAEHNVDGHGVVFDQCGDSYITGLTGSDDFPTQSALQPVYGGAVDAFVTKILFEDTTDLSLTKTAAPDPILNGNQLTYHLTVNNLCAKDATGLKVSDLLPPQFAYTSATATQGSCNAQNGQLNCELGNIGPKGSAGITVTGTVSAPASLTLTNQASVSADQDDPDPRNNTASATALLRTSQGVLGNDSDPDGDALTAKRVTTTAHGTLSLNPDGTFRYAPQAGFSGVDTFTYQANDGKLDSNIATVTITVNKVNHPPQITSTALTTATATQAYGYQVTATDPDAGDGLIYSLGEHPEGMSIDSATGLIQWTPTAEQTGTHSVNVTVADSGGLSRIQTFTVTVTIVTPPNRAPIARDEPFTTAGTVLQPPAPGVLANDSDPDGDMIIALLVSGPTNGTLNLNPDGSFTYTPNASFIGTDTFTYKASDGKLDSNLATVTINVTKANQPPVITSEPNISQWKELHPTGTLPSGRAYAGMDGYDSVNDRLIVFGGAANPNDQHVNDVWVLINATGTQGAPEWRQLSPTGSPPPIRVAHSVNYDLTANRLIVHGGCVGSCGPQLNDTWVLTHANGLGGTPEWISIPATEQRSGHAAGYDPISNRLIVFGGNTTDVYGANRNDVRILVDANGIGEPKWMDLPTIGTAPTPRDPATGAYDPISNRLMIFGGRAGANDALNDVWVLSHANGLGGTPEWTHLNPIGLPPSPRLTHSIIYDSNSNNLIVFGGNIESTGIPTQYQRDTWILTHANGLGGTPEWKRLKTSSTELPPRTAHSVGYARATNRMVVTMGSALNDTWVLTNASGNCTANQPCDYDVEASDADEGDVLSYALVQGPAGMTIEAGTGQLHWTPGVAQTGTHDVTVKVTDTGGLSATQSFQLTVSPVAVPNVQGLAPEWAEAMLQAAGLNTGAKSSLGGAITLNFDTLPSEQGWSFTSGPGSVPDESTLFSVSGGVLLQDTLGIGSQGAGYYGPDPENRRLPFSISIFARILAEEFAPVNNNHFGFFINYSTGKERFDFGLGDGVLMSQRLGDQPIVPVDTSSFRDYRLEGYPGSQYRVLADVTEVVVGIPPRVTEPATLFLGDTTQGPNAKAEIAAYSFTQPQIATQTPAPGTLVNPASAVDLGIQEGPATQTVPAVTGQAQTDAQTDIIAAGLLVGNITTETSDTVPGGSVIRQKPVAGTHIMKNVKVDLAVSSGPSGGGACITPPAGMIGWWSGDVTAQDYISANHGTMSNGADYQVGMISSAFNFDGIDDYFAIPDDETLRPTQYTIETWVRPDRLRTDYWDAFINKGASGSGPLGVAEDSYSLGAYDGYPYIITRHSGLAFGCSGAPCNSYLGTDTGNGTDSGTQILLGSSKLEPRSWYHLAATYDGAVKRLYVNGSEVGSVPVVGSLIYEPGVPLLVGAETNNGVPEPTTRFRGQIDEPTLYTRALTESEIQSIYNTGAHGKCKSGIVVADAGQDRTANTSDTVTLNGTASRALDGKPITYSWSLIQKPADSFAEFGSSTSVAPNFVSDVAGDYVAKLIVSNGVKTSAPDTVKITVTGNSVNRPPSITSAPVTTAKTGELYSYDVNATDPDAGDILTFSLITAPEGMTIDTNTGLIQWIPAPAQAGNQPVIVKVQDQDGLSATQSFTVAVSPANHAPVISSTPPAGVKAEKLYSYPVVASDPDAGDALTYTFASGVPSGMSIDAASGLLQWTPTAAQVGTHSGIIVKVSDQKGLFATQSIDITVNPANRAPVINSSAPTVATENEPYIYAVQAGDPDAGDTLGYSLPIAPAGMTINQSSGLISWMPNSAQIGDHPVAVQVQDQDGLQVTQSYTVTVEVASVIVPNVEGGTLAAAQAALTAAQLKPGNVLYWYDEIVPAGIVLSQLPLGGASVAKNTAVDLIVSQGPAPVSVPSVIGFTQAAAESALLAARLTVGTVTPVDSDTVPAGIVISQNPSASTPVSKNTAVDLVVSAGPALVTTPNVVGLTQAAAQSALLAANLSIGTVGTASNETIPAGQVISQNPAAGVQLANGSAVDLVVSSGPSAPEFAAIQVLPESPLLLTGETMAFSALAILDDGTSRSLSGATWTSATPSVATVNASGVVTALTEGQTLISAKKSGVSGSVTLTVKAAAPGDVTPPEAALTAPVSDATITSPTDIIGTAGDANFLKYELALSPVGQNQFTVFKTGDTAVTNGVLGTLDPTLLLNDQYTLRLTVWDRHNPPEIREIRAQVAREQKVGNFTLAFQDVSVPMACMPITVTRVYDSRDKRKGDFGVGWRLDVKTMQLRESREMGSGWHVDLIDKPGPFNFPIPTYVLSSDDVHKVSLTLPDGHVEEFDLQASPTEVVANRTFEVTSLSYAPRPGTLGSLAAVTDTTTWELSSNLGTVEFVDLDFNIFDPQQYRYTAPDGSVYLIDKNAGVKSVQCINGQSLSFDANGISHSDGAGVAFTRDAQNRITAITDPMGNNHQYSYDNNGDLIQHSDPANQKTGFKYDYRHGLIEIDDPRGIKAVRNEYDANGRLIGNTDAAGKKITYNHDLAAKKETVTDRLGNSTAYEYDDKGNVLKQTDALGNVTTYTYDAVGNQLTKTDALGRTTTQEYDSRRNVLRETDPLGHVTRYTYHALNGVKTIQDPLGHVTSNDYDGNGNLLSTADPLGNVITYSYDKGGIIYPGSGLMTSKTDALGNKTRYNYDAQGRMTTETDPQGHVTTYEYDANGNRIRETRSRNGGAETLVTTFEYDSLNRLVKTIQPDGSTSQTVYNAIGKQAQTVDALGRATQYEYDALGHLIKTTYPDGAFETSGYDAEGRRIESIDRAGRKTAYTYDALGRLTLTTYADGTTSSTVYDQAGQVTASVDALGHVTNYSYDDAGRRTQVTDALGHVTRFVYDAAGNQSQVIDANGNTTGFVYDNGNRRTQVVYPDGTKDLTGYDALGRNTGKTDQAGKVTQFAYDALGRLIAVTDALGQVTTYGYDERGNQLSQTDANGHATLFVYDSMGRRISRTPPEGQTEHMSYNAAGNLIAKTDFNGKTTTYAYDELNRLITKTPDASLGEPAVTYDYTVSGQRAAMQDASGVTTYSYDARDRLIEKATQQGTLTYTYNGAGQLAGIRSNHAGGVDLSYSYDALNRLAKVTDQGLGNADTTYSYDNAGNLAGYIYPNGVETAYTYNALNRLTDMHVAKAGADVARYQYSLGATGNRLSVAELSGRTVNYLYDDLYRLTRETISGVATPGQNGEIAYSYDPVGNRLTRTSTVGGIVNQAFTYNANDQLASDLYDNNGNTIGTDGKTYAYDGDNRLTSQNGVEVQIVYDGDGNRVAKTVGGVKTGYLVDTLNPTGYAQVLEEIENGSVTRRYTYGSDLISQSLKVGSDWQTYFYGYDGHGSVRFLADISGNVTDRYDYEGFGNLVNQEGTTANSYLYSGEQRDKSLGLDYLRARYYDSTFSKFLSIDRFEGFQRIPLTAHDYLYSNANPINFNDPSGLSIYDLFGDISVNIAVPKVIVRWGNPIKKVKSLLAGIYLEGRPLAPLGGSLSGINIGVSPLAMVNHSQTRAILSFDQLAILQRYGLSAESTNEGDVLTISGQGWSGYLLGEFNNKASVNKPYTRRWRLDTGLTSIEKDRLLEKLIVSTLNYKQKIPLRYSAYPALGSSIKVLGSLIPNGYNCNSFSSGLISSVGIDAFNILGTSGDIDVIESMSVQEFLPGYGIPVPSLMFEPKKP